MQCIFIFLLHINSTTSHHIQWATVDLRVTLNMMTLSIRHCMQDFSQLSRLTGLTWLMFDLVTLPDAAIRGIAAFTQLRHAMIDAQTDSESHVMADSLMQLTYLTGLTSLRMEASWLWDDIELKNKVCSASYPALQAKVSACYTTSSILVREC